MLKSGSVSAPNIGDHHARISFLPTRHATRATRDAVLKLQQHRFGDVPQSIANHITELRHISQLEAFFEKVMNAETLDEIQE